MSAFVADPYEIGVVAALVKRIPEANQPDGVRDLDVTHIAELLVRENIASVRADRPHGYLPGIPEGIGRAGPNLLDKDVIALAGDAARAFMEAMHGEHPRLVVQPAAAADLVRYLEYQSCEHAQWERSVAHTALSALRDFSMASGIDVREAPVRIEHSKWGISGSLINELEAKILPDAVRLCREQAERNYAKAQGLLAQSTMLAGRYSPSEEVKTYTHAGVFLDNYLIILTGPANDAHSMQQAEALEKSTEFQHMVNMTYGVGRLRAGSVDGAAIGWFDGMAAVVSKSAGKVGDGTEQGSVLAILTARPETATAMALALSVTPEIETILRSETGIVAEASVVPSEFHAESSEARHPAPRASALPGTAGEVGAAARGARDFRQEITDKMVAALEEGKIPWEKPWRQGERPMNGLSGHRYQGINRFIAMLTMAEREYGDPRFLTWNQVKEAGGCVKKGEHGVPIEMWKPKPFWARKDVKIEYAGRAVRVFDEPVGGRATIGAQDLAGAREPQSVVSTSEISVRHQGETLSWRRAHEELDTFTARVYTVFNVAQCEGLDPEKLKPLAEQGPPIDPHTRGEFLMAAMRADGIVFQTGGDSACYVPSLDAIKLPERARFLSQEGYYATALHEIGHATGAEQRFAREGITGNHRFGSEAYAREELRAELASAFLSAETGMGSAREGEGLLIERQHKAYLQSWAKVLKADKNEFFRAAKEAGEAADYVLARERDLEQALELAGLTPRQASVLEAACAQHDLKVCGGVIDGPQGELLRIESSARGDLALRDPATREPLGTVTAREAALSRILGERLRAVLEEATVPEAEEGVER